MKRIYTLCVMLQTKMEFSLQSDSTERRGKYGQEPPALHRGRDADAEPLGGFSGERIVPELDMQSLGIRGYLFESPNLTLEVFRLVTAFAASETLAEMTQDERNGSTWQYLKQIEFPEVCRILISIAAIARSSIDSDLTIRGADAHLIQRPVGVLAPDLDEPDEWEPLGFRQACNKVLHADRANADVLDVSRGMDSSLGPRLYLYGEYQQKQWRAVVYVYEFAMTAMHFC